MPFDAIQTGRGGDASIIQGFANVRAEKALLKGEQIKTPTERLDETFSGLPKPTQEANKAKRREHLAGVVRKEDTKEAKKAVRPIAQQARDFSRNNKQHDEATLVSVRRVIRQAKSIADVKKILKGVYKDNSTMYLEVLTFIEETFDESTDMPSEVKVLVSQAKQEIQAEKRAAQAAAFQNLVKQAKSPEDIHKALAQVYPDSAPEQLNGLMDMEASFFESKDIPDNIKAMVSQVKEDILAQLEGGVSKLSRGPTMDVIKGGTYKDLYQEVANQPEVNAHEMFNKIFSATKGDISNLRQVATALLKTLADDIRNTPDELKHTERELMQTRISEMRAVVAFTQVPPVFDKALKLVDKLYGGLI